MTIRVVCFVLLFFFVMLTQQRSRWERKEYLNTNQGLPAPFSDPGCDRLCLYGIGSVECIRLLPACNGDDTNFKAGAEIIQTTVNKIGDSFVISEKPSVKSNPHANHSTLTEINVTGAHNLKDLTKHVRLVTMTFQHHRRFGIFTVGWVAICCLALCSGRVVRTKYGTLKGITLQGVIAPQSGI